MYELTSQQLKKQPIQIRNEGKSDICGRYTTMETWHYIFQTNQLLKKCYGDLVFGWPKKTPYKQTTRSVLSTSISIEHFISGVMVNVVYLHQH
jgi:hypothetical protein